MAKAVLFDFDGVAVDTERYYLQSQNLTLKHLGYPPLSQEEVIAEFGSIGFFRASLQRRGLTPEKIQEVLAYNDEQLNALLEHIKPNPGFEGLLRDLDRSGILLGLVSSSRRMWINRMLGERNDLLGYLDVIVCREDVDEHKPSPKPYLTAVGKLGLQPSQCVAVEDSLRGITSAKDAGCRVIALASKHFPQDTSRADMVVNSLTEIDYKMLASF